VPTSAEWLVFLGASALFAVIPGPGVLYVLARSLRGGRSEGMYSVVGNSVGALAHVAAAAIGLSAVLATSATAFTVVKLAGAAYLIHLGVAALLDRDVPGPAVAARPAPRMPGRTLIAQGALSELLNPKTALFFLAFLPHFVHHDNGGGPLVFGLLGVIAVAMAMAVDVVVVFFAGGLSRRLLDDPRWRLRQRVASGLTMIGLGGVLAVAERGV